MDQHRGKGCGRGRGRPRCVPIEVVSHSVANQHDKQYAHNLPEQPAGQVDACECFTHVLLRLEAMLADQIFSSNSCTSAEGSYSTNPSSAL